jgi:hypothetical protein
MGGDTSGGWNKGWNYEQNVEFRGDDDGGWQWRVKDSRNRVVLESAWFSREFSARRNFRLVRRIMTSASIHAGEIKCA